LPRSPGSRRRLSRFPRKGSRKSPGSSPKKSHASRRESSSIAVSRAGRAVDAPIFDRTQP
jgi:hypothetical protein